jgi:hypothetical protein
VDDQQFCWEHHGDDLQLDPSVVVAEPDLSCVELVGCGDVDRCDGIDDVQRMGSTDLVLAGERMNRTGRTR